MTTFQVVAVVVHAVLLVGFVGAFAYLFDLV
jgi:nitrate reductase NapE component